MSKRDKKDTIKLAISGGVLGICLIWITLFSMRSCYRPAEAPQSAAALKAIELSNKLHEDSFFDVGVDVLSESPVKFVVQGAVHTQKDLTRLKDKLKELLPDEEPELRVELLK